MQIKDIQNNRGYLVLLTVIVIGFGLMVYVSSTSTSSVIRLKNNNLLKDREKAYYLADSCAELALQNIWNVEEYEGTVNFAASNGDCVYTVADVSGQKKQIDVIANVNDSIQKVQVVISDIRPEIVVDSWKHVE